MPVSRSPPRVPSNRRTHPRTFISRPSVGPRRMSLVLLAFPLVLFFPGWTLVNLLFPRRGEIDREHDALYRVTLGIVMSIVLLVLVGFLLNAASPPEGIGLITGTNLWASLGVLTVAFFVAGWWRGAYPSLGRLPPALEPPGPRGGAGAVAAGGEGRGAAHAAAHGDDAVALRGEAPGGAGGASEGRRRADETGGGAGGGAVLMASMEDKQALVVRGDLALSGGGG